MDGKTASTPEYTPRSAFTLGRFCAEKSQACRPVLLKKKGLPALLTHFPLESAGRLQISTAVCAAVSASACVAFDWLYCSTLMHTIKSSSCHYLKTFPTTERASVTMYHDWLLGWRQAQRKNSGQVSHIGTFDLRLNNVAGRSKKTRDRQKTTKTATPTFQTTKTRTTRISSFTCDGARYGREGQRPGRNLRRCQCRTVTVRGTRIKILPVLGPLVVAAEAIRADSGANWQSVPAA